jgi:hypothetical protein
MKSAHGVDYLALFRTAHSSEKRKAQKAIRQIFRDRTIALTSAKALTHWRQMQRQVMEHSQNSKTAPRNTNAFAAEGNAKEGIMTSSSGPVSRSSADFWMLHTLGKDKRIGQQ